MTKQTVRYDDAMPAVVGAVVDVVGDEKINSGIFRFLRDAAGVITTIYDDETIEATIKHRIAEKLLSLGAYIDASWPIATPSEFFDNELGDISAFKKVKVSYDSDRYVYAYVLDRRIIGFDWLSRVYEPIDGAPPIVSFASIKGGVGRSTALCIAAQDLSSIGLRVLAIDLDLEAPGLGSILLPVENRPKYGALDYFVERGPSAFRDNDFIDLMEASPYFIGGAPVYVVPAFGTSGVDHPANVLGKLARAYVEDRDDEGGTITFLERTRSLIKGLIAVRDFDVILVDSRAGMHETAAAPLLGIGADVLMFGVFQTQTFEGYFPLLEHIATMTPNASELTPRLRMVHSKAALDNNDEVQGFRDASHRLFSQTLYGEPEKTADELNQMSSDWFNLSDSDGPHYPWQIGNSVTYRLFDLDQNAKQLDPENYREAYSDFVLNVRHNVLARLEQILEQA